jgi:hypothetical protein
VQGAFDFIQMFAVFISIMPRKLKGTGKGGARPGAGRPRGRRDKRTVLMEILPALAESDRQLPLYRLLARIADEGEDIRYRDALSIACLPYLHSRLVSNMVVKPAYMTSDEELQEVRAAEIQHEKELRRGRGHLHLVKPK